MLSWISVLFITSIFSFEVKRNNYSNSKSNVKTKTKYLNFSLFFTFLILFVFRAFRSLDVGGDLINYNNLFHYIGSKAWGDIFYPGYEIGWLALNKLFFVVYPNFQIILVFVSFIFTISLLYFIYKNSSYPWLSIFLYISLNFLGATFNNERQAVAIALLFFSFKYLKDRKLVKFVFLVVFASLFHQSSLIFLVLYFLYNIKISLRYWISIITIVISVFIFRIPLLEFSLRFFYTDKYLGITGYTGEGYLYFLFLVTILMLTVIMDKLGKFSDPNKKIFVHMLVIATIIQIFAFEIGFIYRATSIFSVSMIILIPEGIKIFSDQYSKITYISIIVIFFSLLYLSNLSNDTLGILPYTFFWNN